MYKVIIEEKDNLFIGKLTLKDKKLIKNKLLDLQNGNFTRDKALKGKYKGKFRKRAGGLDYLH